MDDSAEVARAVRWHRIAPAFALNASEINVSGEILKDSQFFPKGSTWCATADGKTVWQCAPAAIARGLPLPKVEAIGEKPFVAVSKHPNGAIAAGVFGRVSVRDGFRTPPADVFVDADISGAITGIFGNFKSITFNISPNIGKVLAQDLASNKSVDITHLVKIAALPDLSQNDVVVSNIRHYEALSHALEAIHRVQDGLAMQLSGDFISQDLRECLFHLAEIVGGEITTDEVLGNIFKHFCIGK